VKSDTIAGITIIVIIVAGLLYLLFTAKPVIQLPQKPNAGNYSVSIVTSLSSWHIDDFRQWFFALSGTGLGGSVFVKPPAAEQYGITELELIPVSNISKWVEMKESSEISGFWALQISIVNATWLCDQGVFKPIDNPYIIEVAKNLSQVFKGYTKDGKLCWVSPDFTALNLWLVNLRVASDLGVPVPQSYEDLLKPEYAAVLTKGKDILAIGDLKSDTMKLTYAVLLQKHGWEKGLSYITYLASISHLSAGLPTARSEVVYRKVLMAILDYDRAAEGLAFGKNLTIVAPKEALAVRVSIIGVAKNADANATEGMYRLIHYMLTEAQDELMLIRWTGSYPTNPRSNPSKYIVYYKDFTSNIYAGLNETLANKLSPVVTVYASVLYDQDVNTLLKSIVRTLALKYQSGEINSDTYYSYIERIGAVPQFINPLTGAEAKLDFSTAMQLVQALGSGALKEEDLYASLKDVLMNRLTQVAQELGVESK